MELFSLREKKHISIKPYRNRCLWNIKLKAEASTEDPQISVLKDQMCKYTLLACTPHCGESAVVLGSPGWAWSHGEMLLLVAELLWEAQGVRSMAGILARRCPSWYLCSRASPEPGVSTSVAVTPMLVSWDIFPETSPMPHSTLSSLIWDLHVAKPCPAAEGWRVSTRYPGITGGISPGSGHLLLGRVFPPSSQHSLSLSEPRQMQCYYSTVLGHLIACFEGQELNLSDKHNIIVIRNKYNRQFHSLKVKRHQLLLRWFSSPLNLLHV